jgi:phosphatidylethanolamine N-methyltransferase
VAFLLCAWRLFQIPPLPFLLSSPYAARVLVAIMLMGLSHWSFASSFELLGDFGWYYGDFFLPRTQKAKLTYTGIYRYINNPDVYLGNLWLFAVALLCNSWELFVVSFAAQSAHICFLQLVEKPHLRAIYENQVRPHSTAVEAALKRSVRPLQEKVVKIAVETKGRMQFMLKQQQ